MITIGGEVVVEPPSAVGIVALLMSMKSQVLRMIFRTPERVDVEPPSVADSLRECAAASPERGKPQLTPQSTMLKTK
jgi:hypothetical protein